MLTPPLVAVAATGRKTRTPPSRTRVFGQLRVHSYPAGPATFVADEGARSARPLLLAWLRGGAALRHGDRAVVAPPDALCFLPNKGILQLRDVGAAGVVLLELPANLMLRARERVDAALRCTITRDSGAPAFLRSFVDTLDRQPPTYCPDYPDWVQVCVCDIAERVLTECSGARPTAAERAFVTAKDYVSAHLTDLDLTPVRVARESSVSLRTLNRVFAAEGASISGLIRQLRLEHCREDLVDPSKSGRSIGQISAVWGFLDAAHFSRAFKDAYGCSPRDYRASSTAGQRRGAHVDRVA